LTKFNPGGPSQWQALDILSGNEEDDEQDEDDQGDDDDRG
jgi:hypothetical protein